MGDDTKLVKLYEGKYVDFVRLRHWEFASRPNISGIIYILAINDERKVILVEQYRIPVEKRVIELPAGLAGDVPGSETEPLELAARRELLEETGYEAQEWEEITAGPPAAGITNEVVTLFRARGLTKVGEGGGDDTEDIVVHEVPLDGIDAWLNERHREGLLIDPKVYAGLYFA